MTADHTGVTQPHAVRSTFIFCEGVQAVNFYTYIRNGNLTRLENHAFPMTGNSQVLVQDPIFPVDQTRVGPQAERKTGR